PDVLAGAGAGRARHPRQRGCAGAGVDAADSGQLQRGGGCRVRLQHPAQAPGPAQRAGACVRVPGLRGGVVHHRPDAARQRRRIPRRLTVRPPPGGPTDPARRRPIMARPIWTGTLSFGLLNIPVRLMAGERRVDLSFRMLDSRNNARVRYERVNEETGEEVPWKEIVKAFEYDKGAY